MKGAFLLLVFIQLVSCAGGTPTDSCEGISCEGGNCISDETGVRCECEPGSCRNHDDPFLCVPCLDGDVDDGGETDGDADPDTDVDSDTDGDSDIDADSDPDDDPDVDPDPDIDPEEDGEVVDGDSDGDRDTDGDRDEEIEPPEPVIDDINGTGTEADVNPREEDLERWSGVADEDRRPASQRINGTTRDLAITGRNLGDTETVVATPVDGSEPISFEVEVSMDRVRATFPEDVSRTTMTALFTLVLTTTAGATAEAEIYFLQGERGDAGEDGADGTDGEDCAASVLDCVEIDEEVHCTLNGHLEVTGDVFGSTGTFDVLIAEDLMVSVWEPVCPRGYERYVSEGRYDGLVEPPGDDFVILCLRASFDEAGGLIGQVDEMVKVGDFWVDRYEASAWQFPECSGEQLGLDSIDANRYINYHGSDAYQAYSCSVRGVMPTCWTTWFQAQATCAASGKRLITNAEWQAAVGGTVDPGVSTADVGACRTDATGPRRTGRAGEAPGGEDSCISLWGAEDMIGNVQEWTADWYGQGADGHSGSQPADYYNDGYWNVDEAAGQARGSHFLAAGNRGGNYARTGPGGTKAGAFNMDLTNAPSWHSGSTGFRCARNY